MLEQNQYLASSKYSPSTPYSHSKHSLFVLSCDSFPCPLYTHIHTHMCAHRHRAFSQHRLSWVSKVSSLECPWKGNRAVGRQRQGWRTVLWESLRSSWWSLCLFPRAGWAFTSWPCGKHKLGLGSTQEGASRKGPGTRVWSRELKGAEDSGVAPTSSTIYSQSLSQRVRPACKDQGKGWRPKGSMSNIQKRCDDVSCIHKEPGALRKRSLADVKTSACQSRWTEHLLSTYYVSHMHTGEWRTWNQRKLVTRGAHIVLVATGWRKNSPLYLQPQSRDWVKSIHSTDTYQVLVLRTELSIGSSVLNWTDRSLAESPVLGEGNRQKINK